MAGLAAGCRTSTSAAVAGAEAARALLGGVAGASARLVTAAPARKRALRYTFNSTLREARMGAGLEDETDDEAVADGAVAVGGGYAEQGVDSSANADDVMGGGGGGGGGAGAQPTETTAIEEAGRKKAPGKPVPKRGMGPRFREWEDKDAAQPLTAGLFVSAFDGRRALRPATARAPGRTTLHTAVGGGGDVFARLAKEAQR